MKRNWLAEVLSISLSYFSLSTAAFTFSYIVVSKNIINHVELVSSKSKLKTPKDMFLKKVA